MIRILALTVGFILGGWVFGLWAQDSYDDFQKNVENDTYYAALESYFKATKSDVAALLAQNINEEELPVVLFMARRTGLDPDAPVGVHSSGLNWMQAAWHFQIPPWVFYTPLDPKDVKNTPYEAAYQEYSDHADKVDLTDGDIVNLVNLKFLTEFYGCAPKEVVQMRASGKTFRQINDHYWNPQNASAWDVSIPGLETTVTPTPGKHGGRHGHHGGAGGASGIGGPSETIGTQSPPTGY